MQTGATESFKKVKSELPLQIGLTGSIGMGKSTVSNQFRELGFPVFDADEEVHRMYDRGGDAVDAIEQAFPGVVTGAGMVDRKLLGARVLESPESMKKLEEIVHPMVKQKREVFLQDMANEGHFLVVYDIPLLLEKPNQQHHIDYIIVTSADAQIQEERVLQRSGMTKEKFNSITSYRSRISSCIELSDRYVQTIFKFGRVTRIVPEIGWTILIYPIIKLFIIPIKYTVFSYELYRSVK